MNKQKKKSFGAVFWARYKPAIACCLGIAWLVGLTQCAREYLDAYLLAGLVIFLFVVGPVLIRVVLTALFRPFLIVKKIQNMPMTVEEFQAEGCVSDADVVAFVLCYCYIELFGRYRWFSLGHAEKERILSVIGKLPSAYGNGKARFLLGSCAWFEHHVWCPGSSDRNVYEQLRPYLTPTFRETIDPVAKKIFLKEYEEF